jgi:hypothetical protein
MPGAGGRRNQANVEVVAEAVWSDAVLDGLLDDWIVPEIADGIIEEMSWAEPDCNPEVIMHTISRERIADGESYEDGAASEAGPAETDKPASTAPHEGGAQGAGQVRGGTADDTE